MEREHRIKMVEDLFANGTTVYCGYVDDPRNTDNAWMETTAVHFHCTPKQAQALHLTAGDDAQKATWLDVDPVHESRYANLYASHREWVSRVACIMYGHRAQRTQPTDYPPRDVVPRYLNTSRPY